MKRKLTSDELYKNWKNKDENSFKELINKNIHLIDLTLKKLEFNDNIKDDLYQEGVIILINLIKKYDSSSKVPINIYLNKGLNQELSKLIKKYSMNDKVGRTSNTNLDDNLPTYMDDEEYYDNIDDYVEKENLNDMKSFIFKTFYLNFTEKLVLMAHFGFINDFSISYTEFSKLLGCTKSNVQRIASNALIKIEKLKIDKNIYEQYKDEINNFSFYDFMHADETICEYAMENLTSLEKSLIKIVWNDDLSSMNKLENINFNDKQVIMYYSALIKIHQNIKKVIKEINTNNTKIKKAR